MRGSLVHRLLEDLDFARPAVPDARGRARARRRLGRRARPQPRSRTSARSSPRSPARRCARGWPARAALRREAPFAFALEPGGGGPLVNGFVDVVASSTTAAPLIVDYKTDRLEGADPAEVVERDYATQRIVYALAALRDGAPRVEVAYCFLERPGEPVTARLHAPPTRPRSPSASPGSPGGVLEGRYEVTDDARTASCAATARAARRCARGARR